MTIEFLPNDPHDARLRAQVHPSDWVNPSPAPRYNLVVVGAGTAGLVAAAGAAGLGARVALVERGLMGGDCLNAGCVPSKALLRSARVAAQVRNAERFGIHVPAGLSVDFPAVMERVREQRAALSPHDSAARFRGLGVDVFFGEGHFVGPDRLEVAGQTLSFHRALVATGSSPRMPSLAGLNECGFQTNETIFRVTELPRRLAVIGAGPIGCELAQAFARLGSRVTLLGRDPRVLPRDDPEAARRLEQAFRGDGIQLALESKVTAVEQQAGDKLVRWEGTPGGEAAVDEVLVAIGRVPNVDGLGLEAAGVTYDRQRGIVVNDFLQTSNSRIYAAGDVCSHFRFTHAADAQARIAIRNALFPGRANASVLVIPWCTYTEPEVAQVGLTETEARARGIAVRVLVQEMASVDRAVLDGEVEGFVKVLVRPGTDRIVGATVVATHAGEMISELSLAMTGGLGLRTLARTIHPYPTQAEALKKLGDAFNRDRLTPWVKWALTRWLAWTCR